MPRKLHFNDFLNLDNPRGGGRGGGGGGGRGRGGRGGGGRGGGRGGFGGYEGGGGGRGRGGGLGFGGRGHVLGGGGGRGGYGGRGRGRGGGGFGADYTNMALDYGRVNASRYTRAEQYLNSDPNANTNTHTNTNPNQQNQNENYPPRRDRPRIKSFAPHGPPRAAPAPAPGTPGASTGNSGTATPITSGLGFHRNTQQPRATRVREGVTYWGGRGGAPMFVKAGELFRDGEVDVVKRDGDKLIVETYPLSDPSAPQMRDLRDDTEIEMATVGGADVILGAIERAHALHEVHYEETVETVLQWNDLVDEDEQHQVDESSDIEVDQPDEDVAAEEVVAEDVVAEGVAVADEAVAEELVVTDKLVVAEAVLITEETIVAETVIVTSADEAVGAASITAALEAASRTPSDTDNALESAIEVPAVVAIVVDESDSDDVNVGDADSEDMDDIDEDEFTRAADEALFVIDTTGANSSADDTLFVIDTVGTSASTDDALFIIDTGSNTVSAPVYDGPSSVPLGADLMPKAAIDESIVFRPRLITDPVATSPAASSSRPPTGTNFELKNVYVDPRVKMNRKDKKAAKKAKRTRNKRSNRRGNAGYELHPRDDSDIEWGSDGPPTKIVAVHFESGDSEVDALGSVLAGTDLDVELGREADVDPDIDLEAMARFSASMGAFGRSGGDAMVEMESDSDEWEGKGESRARRFDSVDPWAEEDDVESSSESDSDDEGLDETADFAALAAAYDEDEDDEDDDEDGGLFAGHQAWTKDDEDDDDDDEDEDEQDWFLQSMEDALDGGVMSTGRKNRKAVFRSIESGNFGALPVAPVKKTKRGEHVPVELHAQWEQDRQKKADKKQARELERVLGLLGAQKKGKKGNKMLDAAAIAHLIPRSAAEVADLFDIDSDSDDGGWKVDTGRGTPRRNLLLPKTLDDIDQDIRLFLKDTGRTSLPLPPMDKDARKKVHVIAECYGLKSKSKGKGAARFPVLIKLSRSGLRDEKRLEHLLAVARKRGTGAFFAAVGGKKKGDKGSLAAAFVRGTGASARAREGDLVGEGADAIGTDNIGHRLLSMMGWSQGSSIGRPGTGGLDTPIVAVVKNTKSGLGA